MKALIIILLSALATLTVIGQQQQLDWSEYISVHNEKNINSTQSEFSPSNWGNNIIFVKSKPRKKLIDKNLKEAYFDLFVSATNQGAFLKESSELSRTINTTYHEGPASYDQVDNKLYFTRNHYDGSEFNMTKDKQVLLQIYESQFIQGVWTKEKWSEVNQENIASCHPAISQAGTYIIFASDRPGGYGKMDLYISRKINGQWAEAINLGDQINSSKNDWFPYINDRNYLFFASDRSDGDLNIYMSELSQEQWSQPLRLPAPINTGFDDFGLIIDEQGKHGYLSSNRPGGLGKDDIYNFSSLVSLYNYIDPEYNDLDLKISAAETGELLEGALVKFRYLEESEAAIIDKDVFEHLHVDYDSLSSDSNGKAKVVLNEGYTMIEVSYKDLEKWQIIMSNQGSGKNLDVKLQPKEEAVIIEPQVIYIEKEIPAVEVLQNVAVDVGAIIVFDNIYYDYNSADLTTGAKKELDQLVELMLNNPELKIELSAHTDSRGNADYNLDLSARRAQRAKDYLSSRGIDRSNMTTKGYGETKLRNHCQDGVTCSEAEHIYNRRTEVKILQK